jgi:hypothetical protein
MGLLWDKGMIIFSDALVMTNVLLLSANWELIDLTR